MKIGAPKETAPGEARVALTPESAGRLQKLGYECIVESGAGTAASITDEAFEAAGVEVVASAAALWNNADVIVKVREPSAEEIEAAPDGKILIGFVWPASNEDLLEKMKAKGMSVLAMDMVPRISRAQKMDALSSMANIAGYRAVIEAGNNFGRFFMGQMTAAGKVPPARVLVVGAGVAGLAATGTSVALGAITMAFDVRPEVAEQIESMGAEFVYLDFEEAQHRRRRDRRLRVAIQPRVPRKAAGEVPRAGAGSRYRHHHRTDPEPPGAGALDRRHGRGHEARVGRRRSRRRARRQLHAHTGRREDRHRQRRDHHRLHRLSQPHGHPVIQSLCHQHPAYARGSDAGQGRQAGHRHGRRRDPRRTGHA